MTGLNAKYDSLCSAGRLGKENQPRLEGFEGRSLVVVFSLVWNRCCVGNFTLSSRSIGGSGAVPFVVQQPFTLLQCERSAPERREREREPYRGFVVKEELNTLVRHSGSLP